jgi:hypothetical protein
MGADKAPDRVLIVSASQGCTDASLLKGALGTWHQVYPLGAVYVGDSPGGDFITCDLWPGITGCTSLEAAIAAGVLRVFTADWTGPCRGECEHGERRVNYDTWREFCPAAGAYRDQSMCNAAAATGLPVDLLSVWKNGAENRTVRECADRARRIPLRADRIILRESRRPRRHS